jgi:DNA-binding HxlR family transcriptional regulator
MKRTATPLVIPAAQVARAPNVPQESLPRRNQHQFESGTGEPFSILYVLEQHRGTLEILLLLSRENGVTKSRFRQRLRPVQVALNGALTSLERLGLVEAQSTDMFPFGRTYHLTDRGMALLAAPLRDWPFLF